MKISVLMLMTSSRSYILIKYNLLHALVTPEKILRLKTSLLRLNTKLRRKINVIPIKYRNRPNRLESIPFTFP